MKHLFSIFLLWGVAQFSFAQTPADTVKKVRVVPYMVENGDTIPIMQHAEFVIEEKDAQSELLEKRIRVVYPYAVLVAGLLEKFAVETQNMTDKQKKKYYKEAHAILKYEFMDELKNLSVEQGKILMKLINREAGVDAYDLVKTLRGAPTAMAWQTATKLFGSTMKQTYDPVGEDKEIEEVILQIENGKIIPSERPPKTYFAKEAVKERKARQKARKKAARKKKRAQRKKDRSL